MSNACRSLWSRLRPDSREDYLFYLGLAAAGLIFLALAFPLFDGSVYTHDDLSRYHLPFRFFYAESLAAGDSFIWLPDIFCGFYIHGEGQIGMYHPLHLLLYRTLPLSAAFNIELLLSFPLMTAGMFFFLRRLQVTRAGAMLGAIVYSFSGFHILHYMHMNATAVAAHTPWLLVAIDSIARGGEKRRTALAWGFVVLCTASQALLGHPPMLWLSLIVEGLYALLILFPLRNMRRILSLSSAKAVGLLIGGIQFLPHWDAATHSTRQTISLHYLQWPSVHPTHLLQLVAPYYFNNAFFEGIPYELKVYNGAIPLLLLVLLFVRIGELGQLKKVAIGAVVLGAFSLVMALGEYGYLHRLQTLLPLVGKFRTPCRYIMLFHFATAVTTAIAFSELSKLIHNGNRLAWRKLRFLIVVPLMSALLVALAFLTDSFSPHLFEKYFASNIASKNLVLAGPAAFMLAAIIVAATARGLRFGLIGILLFAAVDQGVYGLSYIQRFPASNVKTFLNSKVIPRETTEYRLQSSDNSLIMKGVRLADGYASIPPRRQLNTLSKARLKLASARWIWAKKPRLVGGKTYGIRLAEPLPRARLVARARVSSAPDRDIDKIDLGTTALLSKEIDLPGGKPGKAVITSDRPGKIRVATEAESKQLLVLSESFHEGWRAAVDGRQTPVLRIYGDFMGCAVDAGSHEVEFIFRPKSLRDGALLSALGLAMALAIFLTMAFRRRQGERKGPPMSSETY